MRDRPSLRSELLLGLRVLLLTLGVLVAFLLLGALVVPAHAEDAAAPVAGEGISGEQDILVPETLPSEAVGSGASAESLGEHEAKPEGGGGLPQFKAEWFPSQLFWLAVTFAVMLAFFGTVPLPRIHQTMMAREQQIRHDMDLAEDLSARARKIRETYEASLVQARNEAAAALRTQDDAVKKESDTRLAAFRTRFNTEIESASAALDRERQILMADLGQIAAETAAHASSAILQAPEDLEHARRVIDQIQNKPKAA